MKSPGAYYVPLVLLFVAAAVHQVRTTERLNRYLRCHSRHRPKTRRLYASMF
jgi:hypothetical protein